MVNPMLFFVALLALSMFGIAVADARHVHKVAKREHDADE